jgi:hypothetical protein
MFGVKLVMDGLPVLVKTIKLALLETEPEGVATVIGPVVAPVGTVTANSVGVAEFTFAAVPLNCTVFRFAVALNPVP